MNVRRGRDLSFGHVMNCIRGSDRRRLVTVRVEVPRRSTCSGSAIKLWPTSYVPNGEPNAPLIDSSVLVALEKTVRLLWPSMAANAVVSVVILSVNVHVCNWRDLNGRQFST